jgi:hypothetical protein
MTVAIYTFKETSHWPTLNRRWARRGLAIETIWSAGGAMRVTPQVSRADGDVDVYSAVPTEELDRQPLFDLRTRLVVWVLCLLFFGLIYLRI